MCAQPAHWFLIITRSAALRVAQCEAIYLPRRAKLLTKISTTSLGTKLSTGCPNSLSLYPFLSPPRNWLAQFEPPASCGAQPFTLFRCAHAEIRNVHMPVGRVDRREKSEMRKKEGGKLNWSSCCCTCSTGSDSASWNLRNTRRATCDLLSFSRCRPWLTLTDTHYSEFNKQFTLNVLRLMASALHKNKAHTYAHTHTHTYSHVLSAQKSMLRFLGPRLRGRHT